MPLNSIPGKFEQALNLRLYSILYSIFSMVHKVPGTVRQRERETLALVWKEIYREQHEVIYEGYS
jgi:hypothetical protein